MKQNSNYRLDIIPGLGIALIALIYLLMVPGIQTFTGMGSTPLTNHFVPYLWGGALLVLGLYVAIRGFRKRAAFEPLFARNTDDFMLGAILNRVGIFPFKLGNNGCRFMLYNEEVKIDGDYGLLPNNTCVFHHVKQEQSLRGAIQVLGNRLYKSFC